MQPLPQVFLAGNCPQLLGLQLQQHRTPSSQKSTRQTEAPLHDAKPTAANTQKPTTPPTKQIDSWKLRILLFITVPAAHNFQLTNY